MSTEFLFKLKASHTFNELGPGLRSKPLRAKKARAKPRA